MASSVTKSNPGNEAMSDEASAQDNEREQLSAYCILPTAYC